jgi:hypothetical protein
MNDIERHSSVQENPMRDCLQFCLNGFDQLLAIEGFAKE